MGSFKEAENLKPALENANEYLYQVTRVNYLVQGICSRMDGHDLSKAEADGLFCLLEWQNEKIAAARRLIESANEGKK